jgi:putative intracellular protease/amidase
MDESSRDLSDPQNKEFLSHPEYVKKLKNTLKPSEVSPYQYAAILYAGGHGTMWDFKDNTELSTLASQIYEKSGVVAAVCHGPAALLNIKLSDSSYLISGKQLTGFSNDEEEAAKLTKIMPFLLETELKAKGGIYSKASLWNKNVVVDGRLVTGQNPVSAEGVGEAIVKLLK